PVLPLFTFCSLKFQLDVHETQVGLPLQLSGILQHGVGSSVPVQARAHARMQRQLFLLQGGPEM
ncbi:anaphase-promoting complex subunit 2, partial [Nannochloropsis gaditana CCMP526]|uniref:anaphase-promoting complex subunit 2 n=1 Tax=Nannochloropsis gaditana (strain CCMP526) TaxID=1093141 RepID=UPI00029F7F1E